MSSLESLKTTMDILKLYAQLLNSIADLEEKYSKKFDEVLKDVFNPQELAELYKKLPPDVYSEFMASLLKLAATSSETQNPLTLPANEKKKIASELISVAESLKKVIENLKEDE
ncbi:MAG: hypothetical protein NDF52_05965 [archaeon YNP-WB-062]|nr:hypothetical protein [Candidatus Culexarchaeum yellowstonense]